MNLTRHELTNGGASAPLFLCGSEDLTVDIGLTLCYYNIARKKGGEKVAKKKKKAKRRQQRLEEILIGAISGIISGVIVEFIVQVINH